MDKIKSFLSYQWKHGGIAIKFIALNIVLFTLYILLVKATSGSLFGAKISAIFDAIFVAEASFSGFLSKPWTIFTGIFMHADFFHLVMNMLILYFAKQMFVPIFGEKRFIWVFFLGGVMGYFLEVAIFELFKNILFLTPYSIVGASGAVMAILIASIAYQPKRKMQLFGLITIPLYVLGLILVGGDIIGIFRNDNTAHFAHLGGTLIGFIAGYKGSSSSNLFNRISQISFKKEKTVKKPPRDDYEYASQKKESQDQINLILEKIKKSGYDSLSKKEKERLFTESRKK